MDSIIQQFFGEEGISPGYFLLGGFILMIWVVGNWKLYAKCDQPGIAAIIPIYNAVIAMRIVGRPDSHVFYFLIPIYGQTYFPIKLAIELVQSFGKYHFLDYIIAVVFNVFYVLNLGLAYNEEYYGTVYGQSVSELKQRKPQLA